MNWRGWYCSHCQVLMKNDYTIRELEDIKQIWKNSMHAQIIWTMIIPMYSNSLQALKINENKLTFIFVILSVRNWIWLRKKASAKQWQIDFTQYYVWKVSFFDSTRKHFLLSIFTQQTVGLFIDEIRVNILIVISLSARGTRHTWKYKNDEWFHKFIVTWLLEPTYLYLCLLSMCCIVSGFVHYVKLDWCLYHYFIQKSFIMRLEIIQHAFLNLFSMHVFY